MSTWTDEGENRIADILFDDQDVDATLYLGIFTNTTEPAEDATMVSITEPSGSGYARIVLTRGSWTITGSAAAYAKQTFEASGGDWGNCYGYFINTAETGTTGKLLAVELFSDGPYDVDDGFKIEVTPNITVS
jgi:hypothetical protein